MAIRLTATVCLLTCLFHVCPAHGQTGATFDGQPYTFQWRQYRLAPSLRTTVYVGSSGAVILEPDGSYLEVCSAPSLQYAPGLTAAIATNAQETVISVTGSVTGAWAVQQTITIHTNGVTVRYAFQAQRDNIAPPTLLGYAGDHSMWQRFVGESAGQQVWGYLMDLRGQDRVPMSRWMEVGPVREVLAAYEIGTNTTLTLQGWDETPSTHHGFVTTRYQWTQSDPRPLSTGETCLFEMSVRLRPHSQPWQVKPETVTRVAPPREFNFLNPPPHASGIEIEPDGVCAPVFGVDQPVRLRVAMRVANESAPLAMTFAVTNAVTGQGVGQGEFPAVRQNGTNQALSVWQPPCPGVFDFAISGQDGLVARTRRYQVAVVGPVEQPTMALGADLPLRLVDTIACGSTNDPHPFWSSAADSRIVSATTGAYRETGAAAGSWMQYRIAVEPHRIYVVEVDYPDDADRSTSVSISEPNDPNAAAPWGVLRAASGFATGTVFPLSWKQEKFRFVYFSGDTTWATVDVMNPSPMWQAGAVTEIRLYELEGELPRLALPADNGRSLALYTESGDVAFGAMYTGRYYRTNEDRLGNVPAENFYREWYGMAVNLVKYLRFTGQDGYVCGLYRYDSPRYPSRRYSHYAAPDVTVDFTALLAKLFEYNGLKLYPSVMSTRAWPGTVRHAHRTQYEVVTEGEYTAVNVGPDGQQDLRTFLAGVPALNPASPELREELGNMAAEIAGRYAPFTSVPGIFWIAGGAWQPFYTVQGGSVTEESALRYSYDDATLTRFFAELGQPLPEDPHDPARFQKRYAYIMANLRQEWVEFRCKLIAECHAVIADRIRQIRPDLVYYPCEINNVPNMVFRFGGTPYDRLKLHAMDPALHAGKEDRVYVHHRWDLALLKDGLIASGMTPERMKAEVYPMHGRGLLDPELNAVYEQAAPRVGAFLQRQFQEYPFVQPTNTAPGFYTPPARLAQDRWTIPCNIQYAQPVGWRWLHDYALMFARTTPELVAWMWCDGRIPMGHEAQIQYLAAFIRSLPIGRYETVDETPGGVFARLLAGQPEQPRVLYLVNTSLEPQTVFLQACNNELLLDRVTGETLAGTDGVWRVSLDRAALRSFTLGSAARDIRLGLTAGSVGRGGDAWYPGWGYRQRITVDPAFVSGTGTHTNFPLLITERSVSPVLWQHAQTNGADIVFTAADGTTRLAHDIELYDAANTQMCVWVKVPELAGETNTSFYIYYGYPLAATVPDGSGVWSDYRAVWHLRENSGTRYDSSTNGAHVGPSGGISYNASGKINGACGFDGTSGYLSNNTQVINGNATVSAWVKMPASLSSGHTIFDTDYQKAMLIRQQGVNGLPLEVFVCNGSAAITDATYFTGTEKSWLYVTLVMSNGTAYLYRNGQYRTSGTYGVTPTNTAVKLGTWASLNNFWSGSMDEMRACREVRSGDWIATEYQNQNIPAFFSSAAAEEKAPASAAAWYSGWGCRQGLFVDGLQVSGSLSNFPALVTESNVRSNLWLSAKSDGSDILFTAEDGTTKLAHELEKYDAANRHLCAWVKLPVLAASSNTPFYMYYGRSDATSQENPAGVWTGYRAVWHLRETSGTRYDSTSNDADTAANGGVSHASGKIDGAGSFDGTSGCLSANKQVINGNATVSTWIKMPATLSNVHAIFDTGYNAGTLIREYGATSGERLEAFVHSGAETIIDVSYFKGTENSWVYLTLVMSNDTAYLYRNGQCRMSGAYSGTPLNTFVNIGSWGGGSHYWNGLIDETRVAVGVLSPDRIATEYRNQGNPSAFSLASAEEVFVPRSTLLLIR